MRKHLQHVDNILQVATKVLRQGNVLQVDGEDFEGLLATRGAKTHCGFESIVDPPLEA